jgi:periplasmic divalent cation tolerance protein
MKIIVVYLTYPDEKTAQRIGNILLKERLIACFNLFPIKSGYWWENRVVNEREIVGILKTTKKNWSKLVKRIKAMHPYKVPCILKFEVVANEDYFNWIRESVS